MKSIYIGNKYHCKFPILNGYLEIKEDIGSIHERVYEILVYNKSGDRIHFVKYTNEEILDHLANGHMEQINKFPWEK